jgi:hypothetical protein
MPEIRFQFQTDSENDEPSRFVLDFEGLIYETVDDENNDLDEVLVGRIDLSLIQRGRIWDEKGSLFEAMDCFSSEMRECYGSIFNDRTGDWNESIESLYEPDALLHSDLLFIKGLALDAAWQGKTIGSAVARQVLSIFGSSCGLICCKPFPLQYAGWAGDPGEEIHESISEKKERERAFRRVNQFWKSLGFHKLPKSEFIVFSPEYDQVLLQKTDVVIQG